MSKNGSNKQNGNYAKYLVEDIEGISIIPLNETSIARLNGFKKEMKPLSIYNPVSFSGSVV